MQPFLRVPFQNTPEVCLSVTQAVTNLQLLTVSQLKKRSSSLSSFLFPSFSVHIFCHLLELHCPILHKLNLSVKICQITQLKLPLHFFFLLKLLKWRENTNTQGFHLFKSKPLVCKHILRQRRAQTIQRQGSSKEEIKNRIMVNLKIQTELFT